MLQSFKKSFSFATVILFAHTLYAQSALTVTPGCSMTVKNATLKIGGAVSSTGTLDVRTGTVEMNGTSSQNIPAGTFYQNKIKNLVISNDVSLSGEDSVTNSLSMTGNNNTFHTNGFLTLKSTVAGTAFVSDLTNKNTCSGNRVLGDVTAEKYIPAEKKWRFLSVPTNSLQTIKQSWQEGCGFNLNCMPGYGTQITGPGGTAAGFDQFTGTPSVKTYSSPTNTFVTVPNTTSTQVNTLANNTVSYFVFVRGDRSATTFNSPITQTILRTKGEIKQDQQQPVTIASPPTIFTAVGNPYPARINLRNMTPAPTFSTRIYLWDPHATLGCAYGVGAYQTLTFDGFDFTVTPGGGSFAPPYNADPNFIESGEAFFVGGRSTDYDIIFKEDIKQTESVSRPASTSRYFTTRLFSNINSTLTLMDGIRADIRNEYSNNIDDADAFKISNSTETVSLKRSGQLLSVERHSDITANDTFYLNIANMRVQDYRWQIDMANLDQPGTTAYFEDGFLHTSVPLNLNGNTQVDFKIINNAGSYAANRFRIVFKQATVLPVTFTSLKAYAKNTNINVEWKVENELNILQYEVEKSLDGNHFTKIATTTARGNNNNSESYASVDTHPTDGYNYYRIKSVSRDNRTAYTSVAKVLIGGKDHDISIYPNPLVNNSVGLQLNNATAGQYVVYVYNTLAQKIFTTTAEHQGGSGTQVIQLPKDLARGVYQVEIIDPNRQVTTQKVIY